MIVKEETRINFSTDEVEEKVEEEDKMKTAKVKMDEVREENERLKLTLSNMMKDYHSLKMQINDIIQEDQPKKSPILMAASDDESELVSLSLGRFSSDSRRDEKKGSFYNNESKNHENCKLHDGLELGLDWNFHSGDSNNEFSKNRLRPENSSDESKEDGNGNVNASRKSPKSSRSGGDEILQQNPLKKPRVSVRAVCNTQTMNDGCQWRKYGQKISKGNPCPRAYYRCTVSSSCPVRKQVQRCVDDMTILITTYEGTHNHPLAPSATTMASATSAAAAMLKCDSSIAPPGQGGVSATTSTSPNNLSGFNFTSSNNLNISHFPKATISSSQSHPTVILDLTAPHHNLNPSPNNKLFSSRYTNSSPISSLNFSSYHSSFDPSNTLQIGWDGKFSSIKNMVSPYNYQPSLYSDMQVSQKQASSDQKITAATKAITCNPTFQSALAAAITSFVGANVQQRNSGLNFHPTFLQQPTSDGGVGCATSFLNDFPQ